MFREIFNSVYQPLGLFRKFEIIRSFNTGKLKMPTCYEWNYLLIVKAYCEFTGAKDALKPFNLFTISFATTTKIFSQRLV